MIKFLEYNIKDPNIIGLIKKYLNAGIMDKGQYVSTEEGSAQGNIISPILANIYMHFVLVLWYKEIVQKRAKGDTFLVVYADDFIVSSKYDNTNKIIEITLKGEQTAHPETEATQLYLQLNLDIRLSKMAPSKTDKIIMTYSNENATQYEGGTKDVYTRRYARTR